MFQKISSLADVVSCSWGVGPANAPMSTTLSTTMATLARTGGRRGKGLIFCIAAGNNNAPVQDLTNTKTYRFRTSTGIKTYSGPIDRWVGPPGRDHGQREHLSQDQSGLLILGQANLRLRSV